MDFHHVELKHAKYLFYDLHLDNKRVAEEIQKELKPFLAQNLLIIGCAGVARELGNKGFNVTILATTNEMKSYIRNSLSFVKIIDGDLKALNHNSRFDAIICLGDTFSSFTEDADLKFVLEGLHKMLKYGGVLLFENLNAQKVLEGSSNITKVEQDNIKIKRVSRLTPVAENIPTAVWNVTYELMHNGQRNVYEENSRIRGFTENEVTRFLKSANFQLIKFMESSKGNNFITLARK